MKVDYDPRLVEETVHLLAQASPERWRAYRRRIDPLYDAPDREARFPVALFELFRAWGAEGLCAEVLAMAPGVPRALVARSKRPDDEGADLLVDRERTVLLRLAAERFAQPSRLRRFLRHEMRHVADMLDPAFGYEPDLGVRGRTRAEQELVRFRYRALWNHAIDQVEKSPVPPGARQVEIDRAFRALPERFRARLAARFADPAQRRHALLLCAARDPWSFLDEPRATLRGAGHPCPLCGFPTYDWASDPPVALIRRDFADWEPEAGACRQCAELYSAQDAVNGAAP